jgi:hypothetical protein
MNLNATANKITIEKDGYGGYTKTVSNGFWSRKDWDDGSFVMHQLDPGVIDRTLRFGPLTSKLSELQRKGFFLTIESFNYRKKHSLILRNKFVSRESYKVATIANADLGKYQDLTMFIRDGSEPDYHSYVPVRPVVKIVEKEVIKEVMVKTDPFEELLMRYPLERKPVEFIGNLTLNEYVKQQLKANRKLDYVE